MQFSKHFMSKENATTQLSTANYTNLQHIVALYSFISNVV